MKQPFPIISTALWCIFISTAYFPVSPFQINNITRNEEKNCPPAFYLNPLEETVETERCVSCPPKTYSSQMDRATKCAKCTKQCFDKKNAEIKYVCNSTHDLYCQCKDLFYAESERSICRPFSSCPENCIKSPGSRNQDVECHNLCPTIIVDATIEPVDSTNYVQLLNETDLNLNETKSVLTSNTKILPGCLIIAIFVVSMMIVGFIAFKKRQIFRRRHAVYDELPQQPPDHVGPSNQAVQYPPPLPLALPLAEEPLAEPSSSVIPTESLLNIRPPVALEDPLPPPLPPDMMHSQSHQDWPSEVMDSDDNVVPDRFPAENEPHHSRSSCADYGRVTSPAKPLAVVQPFQQTVEPEPPPNVQPDPHAPIAGMFPLGPGPLSPDTVIEINGITFMDDNQDSI